MQQRAEEETGCMQCSEETTEAGADRMLLPYRGCSSWPPTAPTACRACCRQPSLTAPCQACIPHSRRGGGQDCCYQPRPAPPLPASAHAALHSTHSGLHTEAQPAIKQLALTAPLWMHLCSRAAHASHCLPSLPAGHLRLCRTLPGGPTWCRCWKAQLYRTGGPT